MASSTTTQAQDEAAWQRLDAQVANTQQELNTLIDTAKQRDIPTHRAEVSAHVIDTFRKAAKNDHDNIESVRETFAGFSWLSKESATYADRLSESELKACLHVAAHAMGQLRAQVDGNLTLIPPPDLSTGALKLEGHSYLLDGNPVFPSSIVWMPGEEPYLRSFGRIGSGYFGLSHVGKDGTVKPPQITRHRESATNAIANKRLPYIFFLGHSPPRWMVQSHPEILHGARNFTKFDIDSPVVRAGMEKLFAQSLPEWNTALRQTPRIHLLANEPHFATARRGWLAKNGLSDHTIAKWQQWLKRKYTTIAALNATYQTKHDSFSGIDFENYNPAGNAGNTTPEDRQIDKTLRGGPIWYDWNRFNQERVSDWFGFLKRESQKHDGVSAPVSIKMLGFTLSRNTRDGGMDIETLTDLQDVMGADLRVAPSGARFFGKHEEGIDPNTTWKALYAYDWAEQSMYLDFSNSLCPDKPFYDSEWHGFSAVSWRDFEIDRDYVRSAIWLAFSHGMSMIKPWVWGRNSDGALQGNANFIGELCTQPIAVDAYGRVMHELNAHAKWLAPGARPNRSVMIHYCEESGIQDENYTKGMSAVYEALKLANLPVGFTTPKRLTGLDPKQQTLVIPPTRFITDANLEGIRTFERSGGRIILIERKDNFSRNEHGGMRTSTHIEADSIAPGQTPPSLATSFEKMLPASMQQTPLTAEITDTKGEKAYGVLIQPMTDPETGSPILLLNNLNKNPLNVRLTMHGGTNPVLVDILTGRPQPREFLLKSCAVLAISPAATP